MFNEAYSPGVENKGVSESALHNFQAVFFVLPYVTTSTNGKYLRPTISVNIYAHQPQYIHINFHDKEGRSLGQEAMELRGQYLRRRKVRHKREARAWSAPMAMASAGPDH